MLYNYGHVDPSQLQYTRSRWPNGVLDDLVPVSIQMGPSSKIFFSELVLLWVPQSEFRCCGTHSIGNSLVWNEVIGVAVWHITYKIWGAQPQHSLFKTKTHSRDKVRKSHVPVDSCPPFIISTSLSQSIATHRSRLMQSISPDSQLVG